MRTVDVDQVSLDRCVTEAQREQVVIMRDGKPVALMIGIEGLDEEQLQLGGSDPFWTLIRERRSDDTMSRAELEQRKSSEEHELTRPDRPGTAADAWAEFIRLGEELARCDSPEVSTLTAGVLSSRR